MGDRMTPMPFEQLLEWVITEQRNGGTVFGVTRPYRTVSKYDRVLFERKLETPVGPAAGPHTQLAQNIVAAYYAGARFFELKTVQKIDGEDLPVSKPCILAEDEGYNVEWSTELKVEQAMEEYVKAWFLLSVMSKEYSLGDMDGFQFNMSVGYDLDGIMTEKIDRFIEGMKDASDTEIFKSCRSFLLEHENLFSKVDKKDIENISPCICNSVTLSTLHGCPPDEIERIAMYLMEKKHLNTFVKCNPTLLGYAFARKTLDEMGYDYVSFGHFHFDDDLQYKDAVPMLERLMKTAEKEHLEFGVKITNTFPVDITQEELPGKEMYMSGKALYPLSITLAARLSADFGGRLRISYSGGADAWNIRKIADTGIWPITVATTLLKPGGYQRLEQMAKDLEMENAVFNGIHVKKLQELAEKAVMDIHHLKPVKPLPSGKSKKEVPLLDCFMAPCLERCPIHQDIPSYLSLVEKGRYEEALEVILERNPLPFITGTICAHNCMESCTRNRYEESVHIRAMKLLAAEKGFDSLMKRGIRCQEKNGKKVAVIGAGPAGMAEAFYLSRAGFEVDLYEKSDCVGGLISRVIPEFRIAAECVDKDGLLLEKTGVRVHTDTEIKDAAELKKKGFDAIVIATGAPVPGEEPLQEGESIKALEFLESFKKSNGQIDIGKRIVVIGGGNTAMDTARAALRTKGAEEVFLVYRRTRKYMPADEEELIMATEEGVKLRELLAPVRFENGQLLCNVMRLGERGSDGRLKVLPSGKNLVIEADTVIAATGEKTDRKFFSDWGLSVDDKGRVIVDQKTMETSCKGIYVVGDAAGGPSTVVRAMAAAMKAADAIAGFEVCHTVECEKTEKESKAGKGILSMHRDDQTEAGRCLGCLVICENCVDVCPNRANIPVMVSEKGMPQIVHLDWMCNECGNCECFCPYSSAPYKDKFTMYKNREDFLGGKNHGFAVESINPVKCTVRIGEKLYEFINNGEKTEIPAGIQDLIMAVVNHHPYLLK